MLGLLQPADTLSGTHTSTNSTLNNNSGNSIGYGNSSSGGSGSGSGGGYNNSMAGKEGGKMTDTGPTIPAQLVPVGKYVLVCPPDVIAKAMLKFPPGQLVVGIYELCIL